MDIRLQKNSDYDVIMSKSHQDKAMYSNVAYFVEDYFSVWYERSSVEDA